MASQKKLDRYADEYFLLFERAIGKSVVIPCENERQADNLRNDLYAFRRALEHGQHPLFEQARKLTLVKHQKANGFVDVYIGIVPTPNQQRITIALEHYHAAKNPSPRDDE